MQLAFCLQFVGGLALGFQDILFFPCGFKISLKVHRHGGLPYLLGMMCDAVRMKITGRPSDE